MPFTGSCHCGAIKYTVDEDAPSKAMACNCSICRRKGSLHHFTTPDKFTLHSGQREVASYKFNKHAIDHHHCQQCSCAPFAEGIDPKGNRMIEINLRCADVDLDKLEVIQFDGASL